MGAGRDSSSPTLYSNSMVKVFFLHLQDLIFRSVSHLIHLSQTFPFLRDPPEFF